ncbi:DegT/DnrJ/EryC1/StrS family aminotransferase [Nemorincola caseinilytica]|uniref:DegT/DnrJ/EryC1/StrS family aminotransferase n=1 Tax=Nemorincola caseinilytica TaxID=2054315 RepID=A0ABP8N0P5_9BACT
MINITKPFLPDLQEYISYLEGIWDREWLTNNGPLVNDLELRLKEYLDVKHLLYLGNGTIAIQIAIKALGLRDEIITTPFSYAATTNSIVWEGCTPIFADIDPGTLNVDPAKIEERITPKTTGILLTHVYGNPCDVEAVDAIAKKHGLKVIYDGAHAFGVKYKGSSIFNYGDVVTTSFHATKLFHTIEGGAVTTNDANLLRTMSLLRNFGHIGNDQFELCGVNGKNSEFHAAMGLVNLKQIDKIMASRKMQSEYYNKIMSHIRVTRPQVLPGAEWNYSYYPVIFESEELLLKSVKLLNEHWIYPRRYFYPSLSTLPYVDKQEVPISEDISRRVLCLPMYHTLRPEDMDYIVRILARAQNN